MGSIGRGSPASPSAFPTRERTDSLNPRLTPTDRPSGALHAAALTQCPDGRLVAIAAIDNVSAVSDERANIDQTVPSPPARPAAYTQLPHAQRAGHGDN